MTEILIIFIIILFSVIVINYSMAEFRYVLPNHFVELDSEILGNFSFKRSAFCVLVLGSFINRVYSIKRTVMVSLSIAHRQLGVFEQFYFKNRSHDPFRTQKLHTKFMQKLIYIINEIIT
jgi:hypothetical protein